MHRLLDAEVEDGVAVVGQDDVDEVLADVVNIALDGGQDDLALALALDFFHERFEVGDGGLHRLGALQHERQLHLPAAEQIADDFHPFEQNVVDDLQRRIFLQRLVEMLDQIAFFAVDDVRLELLLDGQIVIRGFAAVAAFRAIGEEGDEMRQRIEAFAPAVVDQIQRRVPLLVGDPVLRQDFLTRERWRRSGPLRAVRAGTRC